MGTLRNEVIYPQVIATYPWEAGGPNVGERYCRVSVYRVLGGAVRSPIRQGMGLLEDIASLERENAELKAENAALRGQLAALRAEAQHADLQVLPQVVQQRAEMAEARVAELEAEVRRLQEALADTQRAGKCQAG